MQICKKKACLNWTSRKAWLKITIFAMHSSFLLPSFLGGKRKGEKNNQNRNLKSYLSARSYKLHIKAKCSSFVQFEPKYVWLINMCIRAPETDDPTGGNPKQVSTGSGSDGHIISSSYRSTLCIFKVQSTFKKKIYYSESLVWKKSMFVFKFFTLFCIPKRTLIILLKPVFFSIRYILLYIYYI